jgi:hypothetical protein
VELVIEAAFAAVFARQRCGVRLDQTSKVGSAQDSLRPLLRLRLQPPRRG